MGIKQAHKLLVQTHGKEIADSVLAGNLEQKLSTKQLGAIKFLWPRFHIKALECLIQMDVMHDVEQTEAYLATLRARKLANTNNANSSDSCEDDSIK